MVGPIPRDIRIFLLATLAAAAAAVLITVIVLLVSRNTGDGVRTDLPVSARKDGDSPPDIASFAIPDERETSLGLDRAVYRPRKTAWTREDIGEYWADPLGLTLDILSRENDDLARSILDGGSR